MKGLIVTEDYLQKKVVEFLSQTYEHLEGVESWDNEEALIPYSFVEKIQVNNNLKFI